MHIFIFDTASVYRRCQDMMVQKQHSPSYDKLLVEEGFLYPVMNT